MPLTTSQFALNPLQWVATTDGWINPGIAPPLREQLAVVQEAGFTALHTEIPSGMTPTTYREQLAEFGLRPGPGYVNLPLVEDPAEQERFLDRARTLAAENVAAGDPVMFLAMGMALGQPRIIRPAVGHDLQQDRLERVRDLLAEAAARITSEGGVAALHPHVGTWLETEQETRFVLETTDPAVMKFGPDAGHLQWTGVDPTLIIRDYAERVAGIHIKDLHDAVATRGREQAMTYQETVLAGLWTEPGRGDADLPGIFKALSADFEGWVVIEVDRGSVDPVSSVRACGQWLASFLA